MAIWQTWDGMGEEDQYMVYQGRVGEVVGYQIRNGRTVGVLDYHRDMGEPRGFFLRFPSGQEGVFPVAECEPSTREEYVKQSSEPAR